MKKWMTGALALAMVLAMALTGCGGGAGPRPGAAQGQPPARRPPVQLLPALPHKATMC